MKVLRLRRYFQPDLSDFVVHFVKRIGPKPSVVPYEILGQSGLDRLAAIVTESRILAFSPFGFDVGVPMVCFTECTPAGVRTLIREGRYDAIGLAFNKNTVFQAGGGPVFYVRGDEWHHVKDLPTDLRGRATRLWPGRERDEVWELEDPVLDTRSEWTHEREWRIHGTGDPPAFRFELADVAFFIMPDPGSWAGFVSTCQEAYSVSAELLLKVPVVLAGNGEIFDESRVWI